MQGLQGSLLRIMSGGVGQLPVFPRSAVILLLFVCKCRYVIGRHRDYRLCPFAVAKDYPGVNLKWDMLVCCIIMVRKAVNSCTCHRLVL